MATQNPLLPPGQWVQYDVTTQSPNAPLPSASEQTIGMVRQAFTQGDGPYYQVVWNPGGRNPKTGLYHQNQICPIDQQTANNIMEQMASGSYRPAQGIPGQNYKQPNVPIQAAPPSQQPLGMYTR